ncbi:MAG: hypothetical protein K0B08_02215 [Bacteroidales bacterium]|nr:hypothetical protein [Bacteroidales bacterium]
MKNIACFLFLMLTFSAFSQTTDNPDEHLNATEKMSADNDRLTIGGYAQIDFNQPFEAGTIKNGTLDVHRLVLLFGYKFSDRIQFFTEIEMEHVSELYVEQAYIEYALKDWLKFRGGLMLVPMGIINEYHELPTYNGVERPSVDTYILPTTWRELGAGFAGTIRQADLKYQLYVVNGFLGYDGNAKFNGQNALRSGRQKGIKSVIAFPNFTGKVEYYGLRRLNFGLSGYIGQSQSTLFKEVSKEGEDRLSADSSLVGISMIGIDARYTIKGIQLRGQFNYGAFSNTDEYNAFTGSDFGSSMYGMYFEAGYNVFTASNRIKSELIPFIRYENYNTQYSVDGSLLANPAYHREEFTFGIGWKPVSGVALKADYQLFKNKSEEASLSRLNLGIGVWF